SPSRGGPIPATSAERWTFRQESISSAVASPFRTHHSPRDSRAAPGRPSFTVSAAPLFKGGRQVGFGVVYFSSPRSALHAFPAEGNAMFMPRFGGWGTDAGSRWG